MSAETIHIRPAARSYEQVEGPCPFCRERGGTIHCDFTGASNKQGVPVLVHSEPTCETFDRMTGDEFVHAVLDGEHRR